MMSNMISLDGQLAAYASPSSEVMPGITIQPTSTVNASPGQMFNLIAPGALLPAPNSGMAGMVSVMNQSTSPSLVGLARSAWVNGQSGAPSPMTASTLWGEMLTQMQVPTQVTLFLASQPLMSGEVITPLTLGPNVVPVRSTPGTDTATVSFNINTGFAQG
jgi:hypothetical protein